MPTYVYRCENSGCDCIEFEEINTVADRDCRPPCPVCGRNLTPLAVTSVQCTPSKWGDTKKVYHGT
jgi:predicted nucleic acid-binding Zn ribbon protein